MTNGRSNSCIATVLGIGVLVTTLLIGSVAGQVNSANNKDQSLRSSGRVNPSTLGMEIDIPLGSYPGRGINMPVGISYSSKLWRLKYGNSVPAQNNPDSCISLNSPKFAENSASGWTTSLAVPFVEYVGGDNLYDHNGNSLAADRSLCESSTSPPEYHDNAFLKRIVIHLPSGETHELRADDYVVTYASSEQNPPIDFNSTFYSVDSSNLKYIENSSTGTYVLLMPDGSKYQFNSSATSLNGATIRKASTFTDRNGNYTTHHEPDSTYPTYTNGYWTDTLGRAIAIPLSLQAPTSATTQDYVMKGIDGESRTYKLYWKQLKGSSSSTSGVTDFANYNLRYAADHAGINTSPRDASTTLFQSYGNDWIIDGGAGAVLFNPIVLTAVEMPNGQKYEFSYNIYGEIERILYPTGGEEKFEQEMVDTLSDVEAPHTQVNRGVTNRKVYQTAGTGTPYEWNYDTAFAAPNGFAVTVTNPDGTKNQRFLNRSSCSTCGPFGYENPLAGMLYEERSFDSDGHIVSRKLANWTTNSLSVTVHSNVNNNTYTFGSNAQWHPRVTHEENYIYDTSGSGVYSTTKYEYEGDLSYRETPVLAKKTLQYGFVATSGGGGFSPSATPSASPTPLPTPTPSTLLRTMESTFLISDSNYSGVKSYYTAKNMVGLVTVSKVKDGSGTIVSQSETVYDDVANYPLLLSGVTPTGQWAAPANSYRGNPNTVKVWDSAKGAVTSSDNFVSTHAQFDKFGNQGAVWDALGNSTTTGLDTTYYAFPVTVTSPVPDQDGGTHGSTSAFVTTATYDPTTGLPLTTTDANGLRTEIEYDEDTLRPRYSRTYVGSTQVGGTNETIYNDAANNYWVKSKSQIDDTHYAESITYFDGLGRAWKSEEVNSQGNIFVEKEFDADGRVSRVTNPFRSGETKKWTTNVYDSASRIIEVDLPDGSDVETEYGVSASTPVGVTKTITDQAGKKRKGYSDALGNMIRVVEDPASSALVTDYVFDTLGNLRKTTQGDQNRYFYHDSLGRLLRAKQVEQVVNSALALDSADPVTTNNQWTVKYVYDDNGNITSTVSIP